MPRSRFQSPRKAPASLIEALESRTLLASISGHIFYDLNGNGIADSGENGAFNATQTIFLDQNDNGVIDTGEPSTTLDPFGNYSFGNLAAGTYRVRLQQDTGYVRTAPAADYSLVTVTTNQDATAPAFGVTQNAQIMGNIFNDSNGNAIQDPTEPALPRATVFLDQNNNTTADSSTSGFQSTNVPKNAPGLFTVASNLAVTGMSGLVTDVNVTVNVTSANDNDPELILEDPQGIRVALVTPADTTRQSAGHNFTNTVFDDQAPKSIAQGSAPFSGSFQTSGSLRGFGLNQLNNISPNGNWRLILADTSTANTATLTGWSLSIAAGDPKTQTDFFGNYSFSNLWPGTYNVRSAKTNFITTSPASATYNLTLNATDDRVNNNFALREVSTDNNTITFSAAATPNHLTEDSPFGIVQGDFNRDGKLDLATANNGSNDVSIYLGNGNGTFKDPVFYPVGMAPRGIAVADLNKDGYLDLVVTNHDDGDVSVLMGNGNGTFKAQQTYAAGSGAWSVAIADFNGDGKLDLAVADQLTPTVNILTGIGDGTFNTAVPFTTGADPVSIKAADINKDGKQDLITANDTDNNISVLLGNGDATFQSPINTPVGNAPSALNVSDLNNDGKLDVIVANSGDNDIEVLLGKNNGTFTQPTTIGNGIYPAGDTPAAINLGDMNKDGKPDIIVSDRSDGSADISGDVRIYLSNGDGTLQPPFIYTAHTSPVFVATGDFNKDGKTDIAAANFFSDDVSVLLNTTTAFNGSATYSLSGTVFSDTNANAALDSGEPGIAGATVYVDLNNDKIFQSAEPHATTSSTGTYTITGLAPSNTAANPPYYVVRQILPAGSTQTLPTGGLGAHVTITNANVTNVNFGDKPPATTTGSISGIVYNDTNGNGKQDTTETGVANRVIYIDSNHDDILDNTELSTTTDSNGNWTLTNLPAGTYRIREQNTLGIQHTQPASTSNYYDITLAAGQVTTNKLFGERPFTLTPAPIFQMIAGATTDFIANNGIDNIADTNFTGGAATTTIYDVAGTDNDPLYYTARQGTNFSYNFTVPNGNYKLILLFADPTKTAAGQRIFNVAAQGNTILSNFDIVAASHPKTALVKTFNISVTTGSLTLQFTSTVDQAIISGIQLVPA